MGNFEVIYVNAGDSVKSVFKERPDLFKNFSNVFAPDFDRSFGKGYPLQSMDGSKFAQDAILVVKDDQVAGAMRYSRIKEAVLVESIYVPREFGRSFTREYKKWLSLEMVQHAMQRQNVTLMMYNGLTREGKKLMRSSLATVLERTIWGFRYKHPENHPIKLTPPPHKRQP